MQTHLGAWWAGPTFPLLLAVTLFATFLPPHLTFCHLLRVSRRWKLFAQAQHPKVFLCKVGQGHGFASSDKEYEEETQAIVARVALLEI